MTGPLAPAAKNWIKQGILEFLRQDCAGAPKKSTTEAEPFKIAVVITGDDQALIRFQLGKARDFNIAMKVFWSEPRTPHQVEHGSGEMLIRLPNNAALF